MGITISMNKVADNSKRALLIGVNYKGSENSIPELKGCHNDVKWTKQYLMGKFKFPEENITVLVDDDIFKSQPTGHNIRMALSSLVESTKKGDILFVHFSGHGGRQLSEAEDDDTGYCEFIIAADGVFITDRDFREYVNKLPKGCRMTMVADCCHSGGLIEAAKEQIGKSTKGIYQNSRFSFQVNNIPPGGYVHVNYRTVSCFTQFDIVEQKPSEYVSPMLNFVFAQTQLERTFLTLIWKKIVKLSELIFGPTKSNYEDAGILLSACQSDQVASEGIFPGKSEVCGAFTYIILKIIEESHGQVTNRELVLKARRELMKLGFPQEPGLYCSDHLADVPFLS